VGTGGISVVVGRSRKVPVVLRLIESSTRFRQDCWRNGMACGVITAEDVRATPEGGSNVALVGTSVFWRLAGIRRDGPERDADRRPRIPSSTHDPEISVRGLIISTTLSAESGGSGGPVTGTWRVPDVQDRGLCRDAFVQARTRRQNNSRDIPVREWTLDQRRAS